MVDREHIAGRGGKRYTARIVPRLVAAALALALVGYAGRPAEACLCPGLVQLVAPASDGEVLPVNPELAAFVVDDGASVWFEIRPAVGGPAVAVDTAVTERGDLMEVRSRPVGDLEPDTDYYFELVTRRGDSTSSMLRTAFTTGAGRDEETPAVELERVMFQRIPDDRIDCRTSCEAARRRAVIEHSSNDDVAYYLVTITSDDGEELVVPTLTDGPTRTTVDDHMCRLVQVPRFELGDGYCVTTVAVDRAGNRSPTGRARCAYADSCDLEYDDICLFVGDCTLLEDGGEHPGPPGGDAGPGGCGAAGGSGATSGVAAFLVLGLLVRRRR